ncbi:MAG: hypothetical protein O7G30_14420, partial [Proteobacteria bacterium]|nr:hypothetical protein [Pseudomonadota bacterium]
LSRLKPVTVWIPDLERAVRFRIATREWSELPASEADNTDLVIHSQPLHFTFANAFGVQTLGVSARMTLRNGRSNWSRHRILSSLYNSGIYLRPRYFLTRRNLEFLAERRRGLAAQVRSRLGRMAKGF